MISSMRLNCDDKRTANFWDAELLACATAVRIPPWVCIVTMRY